MTDDHGFSGNDSQVFGQLRAQQFSVIDISNADHLFAAFGPFTVTDNVVVINSAGNGGIGRMLVLDGTADVSGNGTFDDSGRFIAINSSINFTDSGSFINKGFGAKFENGSGSIVNIHSAQGFENAQSALYEILFDGKLNINNGGRFLNRTGATYRQNTSSTVTTVDGNGLFDNDSNVILDIGALNIGSTGVMSTSLRYTQNGDTLNVLSGGKFENTGGAFSATLNGGTFRVHVGGDVVNDSTGFGLGGIIIDGANVIVDGESVPGGTVTFVQTSGTTTINGQMIQTGVTINGGALTGEGFIRGNVVNTGGTVGPGTSPGKLTTEDDFTQGPGGTLAIEIDSLSLFDILAIRGAADLDGTLDLQVDAGYAASAQDGDTFTIIEWVSFSGAFATVSGLNFGIGKFFTLDYGTSGPTLTVGSETVVAASDPGSIALLGLGLAGIGYARRKRAP